jgi:hypothetical protein
MLYTAPFTVTVTFAEKWVGSNIYFYTNLLFSSLLWVIWIIFSISLYITYF